MEEALMNEFKTEYKKLYKKYNKKLKQLHQFKFETFLNSTEYFITYLKFLRDYYILTESLILNSGEENLKIATLATAIAEYEKYQTCVNNYYTSNGLRKIEGTAEEVQTKYNSEKKFH
jgi:hypothetical protein